MNYASFSQQKYWLTVLITNAAAYCEYHLCCTLSYEKGGGINCGTLNNSQTLYNTLYYLTYVSMSYTTFPLIHCAKFMSGFRQHSQFFLWNCAHGIERKEAKIVSGLG
jgi:hypothetical protein